MTNPSQPAPDVADWCQQGSWRRLAAFAHTLVLDAEAQAGTRMSPLLGGGTRLMLALQHRISHDIDLFIRDGRGEIGNSKIGEILSAAKPVPGRPWPPELVREIIEMVRTRPGAGFRNWRLQPPRSDCPPAS